LPVILCSGFNGDIDEKRAGEMGIRGFYQKPVDFAELRRQVADLLSS
jgi:CheY-like chemotaxis protein